MIFELLTLAAAGAPVAPASTPPPPGNVLVIVMDDVGVDLIGAYEAYFQANGRAPGTPANTPAIDTLLAGQGLTFANAWSCPSCSPSRAQLLTGRHPFRTGIGSTLKDSAPTPSANPGLTLSATLLPQMLHQSAYECAAIGKWHLADLDQLALDLRHPLGSPPGQWFDRYAGSLFNLSRPSPATLSLSIYSDWLKTFASQLVNGVNPCGSGALPCQLGVTGFDAAHYATVDTAEDALTLLGSLQEPWFLYVAFDACHQPVSHPIPSGLPSTSCGSYAPPSSPCSGGTTASDARCVMEALDTQIGRILCAVDASDTTVVLLGDNGTDGASVLPPYDPNHGKGTLYEGGVQVPLIIRSPQLEPSLAGSVRVPIVSTADLFATVAELGGVASSSITAEDSISLVPYLNGHLRSLRGSVYSESFVPNFTPDPSTGAPPASYYCERHFQAIRTQRFKLIRRTRRDHQSPQTLITTEELYDLLQGGPLDSSTTPPTPTPDPFESHDLLTSGVTPGTAASRALTFLRGALDTRYPTLVR